MERGRERIKKSKDLLDLSWIEFYNTQEGIY